MILRFDFDNWKLPTVLEAFNTAGYTITEQHTDDAETGQAVVKVSILEVQQWDAHATFGRAMRKCATGES